MMKNANSVELPNDWPEGIDYPSDFSISQFNYIPGGIQLVLLGEADTDNIKRFYTELLSDWQCFHDKSVEVSIKVEDNCALGFNIDNQVLLVSITQTLENQDGIPNRETILCLQHIHAELPFLRDARGNVILPKVRQPYDWPSEVILPPEAELLTCGKIGVNSFQATLQGIQAPDQYTDYFRKVLSSWIVLHDRKEQEEKEKENIRSIFLQMKGNEYTIQVSGGRSKETEPYTSFMVLVSRNTL